MRKTRSRTRVARRRVPGEPHSFVTPAEARGEAAYMVLQELLRHIPQSMCRKVMATSYVAADSLDIDTITEEVESLFRLIPMETPTF